MDNFIKKIISLQGQQICIVPYDYMDVDAAISSVLLSKLFNFLGLENKICIFEQNVDFQTSKVLLKLGYDLKTYHKITEDEKRKLFLVNHYKTSHKGNIIGYIDSSNYKNESIDIKLCQNASATAYIIYKLMLKVKMPIDRHIVELLTYAMMVNTFCFKNTKTNVKERSDLFSLIIKYNVNYAGIYADTLSLRDITDLSLKDIIFTGYKEYNFNYCLVSFSNLKINTCISKELITNILFAIQKQVKHSNIDMWVFEVYDIRENITVIYYITEIGIRVKKFHKILSRELDIIPGLKEYFVSI